ncbi:MAG TPA: SDR family NAD(P)-dependent oxidoreductase [Galbitalea sp.]|nr:SDR family NAD(P)-dependent oxidoreductase [Galbitalea sp.]
MIAVVTGATGDAGRATSTALIDAGHTVVAVGSDAGRLETVAASLRLVCDLTDPRATTELASRVRAEAGGAEALIHLVGGWRGGHESDDWDWLEPRVLTSLRLATVAFADDLAAAPAGRLITIGSVAETKPTWGGANYSVLKAAAGAWVSAVASGWRRAGTAAAVELIVRSIGDDGTSPQTIAAKILEILAADATTVNGSHIDLTV